MITTDKDGNLRANIFAATPRLASSSPSDLSGEVFRGGPAEPAPRESQVASSVAQQAPLEIRPEISYSEETRKLARCACFIDHAKIGVLVSTLGAMVGGGFKSLSFMSLNGWGGGDIPISELAPSMLIGAAFAVAIFSASAAASFRSLFDGKYLPEADEKLRGKASQPNK